ncbi:unnamed protein product [Caenorhabditis sp. 36 PRJEB53466]|nr:unnamed protein product [Caenorhabditis sp. 36 PRJEB53466]
MPDYSEQELAQQLAFATLEDMRMECEMAIPAGTEPKNEKANLGAMPSVALANILKFVGSNVSNPPPEYHFYLQSKSVRKIRDRYGKADKYYAVKNLMALRAVNRNFNAVIMHEMLPGQHYDRVEVDVKIRGFKDTRAVAVYKYGGTGSQKPAIRLSRVKRFDEYLYEHIQRFECIRFLYVSDMVMNEELMEKILELNLTRAQKITFERIREIRFDPSVNVRAYIQQFLAKLNSEAKVFFNSEVFNPNVELFEPSEQYAITGDEVREIREIEMIKKRHYEIRRRRKHANRTSINIFRAQRTLNVVSHILDQPGRTRNVFNQKVVSTRLRQNLHSKTRQKSVELKKAGKWHLKRVLTLMNSRPICSKRTLYYHLKQLKKIVGEGAELSEQEQNEIIAFYKMDLQKPIIEHFPFLKTFPQA